MAGARARSSASTFSADSVDSRVPYADWGSVATLIVFDDSMADLRSRKTVHSSSPVNAAAYRLLPFTNPSRG